MDSDDKGGGENGTIRERRKYIQITMYEKNNLCLIKREKIKKLEREVTFSCFMKIHSI